jgi:hypothetical protein
MDGSGNCTVGDAGTFDRDEDGLVRLSDRTGTRGDDSEGRVWSVGVERRDELEGTEPEVGEFVADWVAACLEELRSRPPATHVLDIFCSDSVARRGLADDDSDRTRPA